MPWGQGAAGSAQIANSSPCIFIFTTEGSINGIFIISWAGKGIDTSGTWLWSTASFAATLNVAAGDELRVTYTLSA